MRIVPAMAAVAAVCVSLSFGAKPPAPQPLLCYVGGTMRPAMEKLAAAYEQSTGRKVLLDFGESGQQLIKLKETGKGDLLVVHDPYLGATAQQKLLDTAFTVARLVGTIVVPKANPKSIRTLADLTRPGLKLVYTDSTYSTLGYILPLVAQRSGLGARLFANVVTRTKSSGEAANAVSLGTADAAIVWDAVAFLRSDKLDAIPIQPSTMPPAGVDAISSATFGPFDPGNVKVTAIVLSCSKQRADARAFAAYCASAQNAAVWRNLGYTPALTAAPAKLSGSLLVYCAAGMRLPIEKIASEFGKASGVKMQLTYDGSNKLLGQIELVRKGDVYVTGDADYIDMARQKNLVASEKDICLFVPVIMVKKGNPRAIASLVDLTKKGVRIGQGDERAAAVGRIMPRLLALNGVDTAAWRANVRLSTPTVNELGNAVKLGTIDAAVVWNAIAANYAADATVVPLDSAKNIFPRVGGAVLACSANQPAASAFLDFATSAWARFVLKENGYTLP